MELKIKSESKLLAKHSLIYMIGNFVSTFSSLLLLPLYTSYLTPKDYGIKELIGLTTEVIGILLATSITSAIYRFYFEYEEEKDRNEVISSSIFAIATIGFVGLLILTPTTKLLSRLLLDTPDLFHYLIISFVSLWFQSLNNIALNYIRAKQQSIKFIIISFFRMILTIALNIYFVCFVKIGVLGILLSTLIVAILTSLFLLVPLFRVVGLRFSVKKTKEMLKYGLPMVPSQFGAFIVHLSDRFFIKGYCSIADAGLYSLSYRFGAMPTNFISAPFNQTWQPRRFEIFKQKNSERVFGQIFTYFLLVICFGGLAVSVLTKDVLIIMSDPQFWQAYKIVPIIVVATTIFSFHYHFNMGILVSKKTKYLAYINFSNGIIVLVLNFVLIPPFGVYGAAYATLIAFIYKVTLTYYISNKLYPIFFEFNRIVKVLFVSIIIYSVSIFIDCNNAILNILIKLLLLCTYPIGLLALNFFTNEEKLNIISIVKRYIPNTIPFLKKI